MLTVTEITSRQQLREYLAQENAYPKENEPKRSEWFGRGAATLELTTSVAKSNVDKDLAD